MVTQPAVAAALVALLGVAFATCQAPANLDGHTFACDTHADCGAGAFCADGICRLFGAPLPDTSDDTAAPEVPACQASLTASAYADRARFALIEDPSAGPASGQKRLRVAYDGLEATFDLPADVIALEPEGCCEDPCCALLNSP